jgi:hypothetical protein
MLDWKQRNVLVENEKTRRRFLSDAEFDFDCRISDKLMGHWHLGRCDYPAAGVSKEDFNKYRLNRDKLLDYHQFVFSYTNYDNQNSFEKFNKLCQKYKITDIEWMPKTKRENDGYNRGTVQQMILKFVYENDKLKKKPLLAKLREVYPDVKPISLNTQLNNLLKHRALEIDRKYKTKPLIVEGAYFKSWYSTK